jgi:hypothetical protein
MIGVLKVVRYWSEKLGLSLEYGNNRHPVLSIHLSFVLTSFLVRFGSLGSIYEILGLQYNYFLSNGEEKTRD